MTVIPFPPRPPSVPDPFAALRPSTRVVVDVLADAHALIRGDAAEPADDRARIVRIAATALVQLDAMERAEP